MSSRPPNCVTSLGNFDPGPTYLACPIQRFTKQAEWREWRLVEAGRAL